MGIRQNKIIGERKTVKQANKNKQLKFMLS